jgi:spermidine/putrescine transport system permease protein
MTSDGVRRVMMGVYFALFFGFLFGPLVIMAITAFNAAPYPQVTPFEGFTWQWFGELLSDRAMMEGLRTSLVIGIFVVALAVPLGLAGALVLTQLETGGRGLIYVILVSPVLTPGVIIGLSTVIFWKDVATRTGADALYNGVVLATFGQTTFIAAYCMLIFLARLQRYDRSQEEAALDLGASRTQIVLHILLPFMRPAILSAAAIAFLTSFENYNTTTFAILADKTLTTVLAGRVRAGTTPAVSALAVLIIAVTLVGAIAYALARTAEEKRRAARDRVAEADEAPSFVLPEPVAEPPARLAGAGKS